MSLLKQKRSYSTPLLSIFVYLKRVDQERAPTPRHEKQVWVRKPEARCNIVFTSLKASAEHAWYFDNGCTRHMAGENAFLEEVQHCVQRHRVTFGDSVSANVVGKGTLNVLGLPRLTDVRLC